MSTESPVLFYSSSSPNAPWSSVVDMAAAAVVTASSPSKSLLDDLSELMDLDTLPGQSLAPDGSSSPWLVSSFSPVDQSAAAQQISSSSPLPSQIVSPHHLFFKASDSSPPSYRSFGSLGAFSFDSSLLEELLGEGSDISSKNPSLDEGIPSGGGAMASLATNFFTERLKEALRLISRSETEALAQVWVPILSQDNKIILTTQEQPYSVMHSKFDLLRYRTLSTAYVFPSEKTSDSTSASHLGLPGRVFSSRAPEWTPNVQFYDSSEYLRIREAARCDVKGLVAVPVLDPSSRSCLAVIELVTNVEKVEFGNEIGIICSALQAVDLAGAPKEHDPMVLEIHSEGRHAVYQEISEILRAVCETHKLPIAQTWLPCLHNGSGHEEILVADTTPAAAATSDHISLFTRDAPFYVSDPRFVGFHHACADHSLDQGQGVAGKAFASYKPCFISDVKNYLIEEYPLVHHARYFKLGGAVAIRLRSSITGAEDYVLEFFMPAEIDSAGGAALLTSISATMQRASRSLRALSAEELRHEYQLGSTATVAPTAGTTKKNHPIGDRWEAKLHKTKKTRGPSLEELEVGDGFSSWGSGGGAPPIAATYDVLTGKSKRLERKRSMSEKTIGLEVLQQYFAGSLKDAAKSIGVCPTTLKRICRQYGISRWPSRKINKVSRSLIKLQGVIDSVQGLDGAVKLNALTGELASAAAAAAAITRKNSRSTLDPTATATPTPARSRSLEFEAPAQGSPARSRSPDFEAPAQEPAANAITSKDFLSDTDEKPNSDEGEGRSSWLSHYVESTSRGVEAATTTSTEPRPVAVKMEPRVHGSSAALAALNGGPLDAGNCTEAAFRRSSSPPELELSRIEAGHVLSPYQSSGDSPASSPPPYRYGCPIVTVKATMGSDTVRFKVPYTGFGYGRLREEISGRFRLEGDGFTLKYLDDDSEWVILDGDADLEECLDVMKGSHAHTIKLVVKDIRIGGERGGGRNNSSHSLSSVKL
ncbi:protein NLP6 [Selaginella moellendorffii]|uniref:protein NLP6 n=1 Tax=Selaginella moellendorffii TaxID=88036 RepID=UPI000D1CBBAB|nr:protein NLP6 [Selaginella moellendorffii]|eukprot:XP_024544643.1 protein NLP6 [Selaginella moellendorffii]